MNLPPEIKSSEDFYWRDLVDNPHHINTSNANLAAINKIHQRDLAIWNAAIEKAAEEAKKQNVVMSQDFALGCKQCEQAILNLKQKE